MDLRGSQGDTLGQVKIGVTKKGSQDPEEGLLVLVVGLGGDIVVLEVSGSVEGDLSGSDFPVLLVDLVSNEDNGDVLADPGEILVPFGDVLVCDSGGDIKHHNSGIGSNVVSLSEPSQFLLSRSVPEVKLDGSPVGIENDRADINSLSC